MRHDSGCGPFYGNVTRVECIHGVKDWTSALQLYQEDRLGFLTNWFASPEQYQAALASHADECEEHGIHMTLVLVLDVSQSPFDDVRVRCALAHAIDKQQLVKDIKSIHVPADAGDVPPGIPGHAPGIGLAYDPDLAHRLLREAGYGLDREFPSLRLTTGLPQSPLAASLIAQWRSVLDVDATLAPVPRPHPGISGALRDSRLACRRARPRQFPASRGISPGYFLAQRRL